MRCPPCSLLSSERFSPSTSMEISPWRESNRRCFQPRRPKSLMYAEAKSFEKSLESSPPSAERISMTRFMACSRSMDECNKGFLPRQPRDRPVTQVVFLNTPRFGSDPDQIIILDCVRGMNMAAQRAGRCLVNEVVHGDSFNLWSYSKTPTQDVHHRYDCSAELWTHRMSGAPGGTRTREHPFCRRRH